MRAGREEDTWRLESVAKFLNRSSSWFDKMEYSGELRYPNGEVINGQRPHGKYRQWTLKDIRDIAEACLRRGRFTQEDYDLVIRRVEAFENPPKRTVLTVLREDNSEEG